MAAVVDSAATPGKAEMSASSPSTPKPTASLKDDIRAVARKFSDDPVQNPDPSVWAVLTAISAASRRRPQGMNILLSADEHCLGRCVEDTRFQIGVNAISASHCKIFREREVMADGDSDINSIQVFLKDTSTNGTYLNWERLRKNTPKARLQHGDIISFIALPHDEKSYAFVYREARNPVSLANGTLMKRKSEEYCTESKRLKGIGIGSHDGPISLDDVRSLQRSNTELRHQLESHVITIETLRNESRECISRHEKDLKELKETTETSFLDQIKELKGAVDVKQKEIDKFATLSAELQSSVNDLKERLGASIQSRVDADEIVNSQKTTISDLEAQLNEERKQRREEREKAEADLKSALQRAHSEAEMEIKRQSDGYLRQQKEQQEVFSKLQESEKESRVLVEVLRSKLGDARESLVLSEKKVRQLQVLLQDEQTSYANSRKNVESLESELNRLRKDLESEKVAREEAWAKVSALELEIAAAIRDLSAEKQRFQGAREKIILRETQLRAFYSTTEEISSLFVKQQEQLKSMQKTLEDEENCGNTSTGIDLNELAVGNANITYAPPKKPANLSNNTREVPGSSSPKNVQAAYISSDDDAANDFDDSATEKQDGYARIQEDNTQDLDGLNSDRLAKDTDGVGTAVVPDDDPTDTEQVLGTESPIGGTGFMDHAGNTMQLDVETQAQDNLEHTGKPEEAEEATGHCSQSRMEEDTETGTVKTADLLASEVAGSWAVSTAPSVYGENETPKSIDAGTVAAAAVGVGSMSEGQEDESQSNAVFGAAAKMGKEHRALNAMINIVAPEFKQLDGGTGSGGGKGESMSDAETDEGNNPMAASDGDDDEVGNSGGSGSEDETDGDAVEDEKEAMVEDSSG